MREEIRRSYSTFAGRPSGDLHDFSVLPDTQGKGVGTALLEDWSVGRPAGAAQR
jgi:GNAT superfamily N-acetyltransferase